MTMWHVMPSRRLHYANVAGKYTELGRQKNSKIDRNQNRLAMPGTQAQKLGFPLLYEVDQLIAVKLIIKLIMNKLIMLSQAHKPDKVEGRTIKTERERERSNIVSVP